MSSGFGFLRPNLLLRALHYSIWRMVFMVRMSMSLLLLVKYGAGLVGDTLADTESSISLCPLYAVILDHGWLRQMPALQVAKFRNRNLCTTDCTHINGR